MTLISEILKVLNENTGVTLIISALGFGFNEWLKTRNTNNISNKKFKSENIDVKTLEKELYLIFSGFCLSDNTSPENCILFYEKIRHHIIDNDLFLRERLSKLGSKFANYILEDVCNGNKDLKKQEDLLKEFKKIYRN